MGSKGKIFLPKEVREKLGLDPGAKLEKVEDSVLIVRAIPKVNDLLRKPPRLTIDVNEFHKFRRDLVKKAESF